MSEYIAFASTLEKRSAVYTVQDLEERYARQKARDDVRDLKGSKGLSAYPKGAAIGASGAMALPVVLGASSHFGSQERHKAADRVIESRKLSALVKSLLPTLDDETRAHLGGRLAADLKEAAAPAVPVTIMRQTAAGLLLESAGRNDPGARERVIDLANEISQRLGQREHPDATTARVLRAVGNPGVEIPPPGRVGVQDVLNAIAIDAPHDAPGAPFAANRYAMGPVERRNMLALAEEAARKQGIDLDVKAVRRAIDIDAMKNLGRSAIPFAALGALGGLLAVRAKRKKLKELERAPR